VTMMLPVTVVQPPRASRSLCCWIFKSACVAACGIAAAVLGYKMLAINNLVRGKGKNREI
jgi:hypothetical protein